MTDYELAAAQAAEADARSRAFWLSVGPDAPPHRHAAHRAAYEAWVAARQHLDQATAAGQQHLFGGDV